jgi:DNA-binding CsgD family transcriptional regulator
VSDITRIKDWRTPTSMGVVYEKLLGAIGTEEFGSTVRDSVMSITAGARRLYLFEATGREDNSLQYVFCEKGLVDLLPTYSRFYLRLDPVCDAYRAAPECSDMAMLRIRPSDISSPGFRRRFFDEPGIVERTSLIQRGADSWRVMNVARHVSDGPLSDEETGLLVSLASLALPMLPLNRKQAAPQQRLTVAQLEDRFGRRFDRLTLRERQVCARAAVGMTVEATALDLGIAKTSVLTYRQRAYQRLNITSPYELCSLVTH